MAETIKGGAYQAADGSWHDANGKPISPKQVQEADALALKKARKFDLEPVTAVTPAPSAGIGPEGSREEPPAVLEATPKRKARKS